MLPSDIQSVVKKLSLDLAPATVGVVHRILAGIFKAAVRDRRIVASPCEGTKLPKVHRQPIEPMTLEAVEALTEAMPERYRALITLAAGTGLRQGELFGLTVDRIDFLRRQLTVDRQLVAMPNRAPYLAPPKTQASVRVVPLPQVVIDALAAHLATWPADGFVFTSELGDPLRRTAFSERVWRPALKRGGLSGRHHARPPALLREPAHPARRVGEDRSGPTRARQRRRDARHLQPSLARLRRPDKGRRRLRARSSCGLRAD